MNILAIPVAVIGGITIYVGFFHLLVSVRQNRRREHLPFALTCLLVGVYDAASFGLYNSVSAVGGVAWQRAQSVTLLLAGAAFLWFVIDYTGTTSRKLDLALAAVLVATAVLVAVERAGLTWSSRPAIKTIQLTSGLGITYHEVEPGPLGVFRALLATALFAYSFWSTARLFRAGQRRKARPLLAALALLALGLANDAAVVGGLYESVYVLEYSYMGMVLLMTGWLTAGVVDAAVAEEALRESEARFRNIIESIPLGMHMYMLETGNRLVFVGANPAADEILGVDNAQYVGKTIEDAFPQLARTEVPDRFRKAASGGTAWRTERMQYQDEHISGIFEVYAFQTSPGRMAAAFLDVTEQARSRDELHRERDIVSRIMDTSPAGVVLVDRNGQITFANATAEEVLGLPRQEVTQRTYNDPKWRITDCEGGEFPDEDLPLAQVMRTGEPVYDVRHAIEWPDGRRVLLSVNAAPLRDDEGRLDGMVATVEDITAGVHAEARVLQLQHLLQSITSSMPLAIITLGSDGRVLLWNPAAETLTGYQEADVEGRRLWEVCPEFVHYREYVEQALQSHQVMHLHRDQLETDDGTVYRDVIIFPLGDGGVDGIGMCIDDVTSRVQLEEVMLQSAKMASVGGLAAGVAHEINNPLGAMMQSAQVVQMAFDVQRERTRQKLAEYGLDTEAVARYLQERSLNEYLAGIRVAGERAAKIVSDLLSFSRKSSSKVAPYGLNDLIEHALDLAAADYDLKKRYDFRDVQIVREFEAELPQVVCDGQQIQQVVLNLLRNAAQAMAEGVSDDGEPRIVIRTKQRDDWAVFEVEDNGPGIPEEDRTRMFVPFYSTKTVGEGTGLGLWLCWSIVVERHHGRIRHEQPEGGGSRFVVELPLPSGTGH